MQRFNKIHRRFIFWAGAALVNTEYTNNLNDMNYVLKCYHANALDGFHIVVQETLYHQLADRVLTNYTDLIGALEKCAAIACISRSWLDN